MTANIIAENLLAQVDDNVYQHLLIDEIEDWRVYRSAVSKSEGNYTTGSGFHRNKQTTRGWEFYVRWKGSSGDWIDMKDMKDSYNVPLADYAVENDIQGEPYFAWWVPFTLNKRILISSAFISFDKKSQIDLGSGNSVSSVGIIKVYNERSHVI